MMTHWTCVLCFALGLGMAFASEEPALDPVLSEVGKKRLGSNIAALENAVRDLQKNVELTRQNLQTLADEMKTLEGFEKDHLALKRKHEQYLAKATEERSKNERARRDLAKWEKGIEGKAGAEEAAVQDKLAAARKEQVDREIWQQDADSKVTRVKELIVGLEKGLGDIRAKRKTLVAERAIQSGRLKEYESKLKEHEAKKAEWKKILGR